MAKKTHLAIYSVILIAGVLIDQVCKQLSVIYLKPKGTVPLVEGILHLTYRENTGAAFSFFEGGRVFFIIATLLLICLLAYLIFSNRVKTKTANVALVLIITGGFGNLIDRAVNGFVVDMIDFRAINFAVFNVADMLVVCGCVLFVLIYLFSKGEVVVWKSK